MYVSNSIVDPASDQQCLKFFLRDVRLGRDLVSS